MNLRNVANMNVAALDTLPHANLSRSLRLLEWLTKLTQPGFSLDSLTRPAELGEKTTATPVGQLPHADDWQAIAHICGHRPQDFVAAGGGLPLTTAEIDFFRRNHRGTESHVSRDFLTAQSDLPSPLAELYGLYRHRARIDVEAALWIAQSTGSTRVARVMGDLLAIGGFANGMECVSHMGRTYSVPSAFDTSVEIDRAGNEAARRLALPADHPSHLLKLAPDEVGVLAASIAEKSMMSAEAFLEKSNLLAEARQDVNRLAVEQHFSTAIAERDLPMQKSWGVRLAAAYAHIFPRWVAGLPELEAVLN